MIQDFFSNVVVQTLIITYFVLSMILVIEYINVKTSGTCNSFIQKHQGLQIIIAAILGLIPGCLGSYSLVSLYTHDIVGFGALLANLIATTGDEAFFLYALMPSKAAIINICLFAVAIGIGYIANLITKNRPNTCGQQKHFELHKIDLTHNHGAINEEHKNAKSKKFSFHRTIMLSTILIFVILLLTGTIKSNHNHGELASTEQQIENHTHEIENHHDHHETEIDWVGTTLLIISVLTIYIIATVPEHFLEDHIWQHIIKKHLIKVVVWTFAALLAIFVLNGYLNINNWISGNTTYILLLAILIGLIPESGPHLIFITLYINGTIPLTILIANSIVQDGHGAIPLFAETKRDFFAVKAIKTGLALIIGFIGINL